MARQPTMSRALAVVVLATALVLTPVLVSWRDVTGGEAAATSAVAPKGIVVVGDSITAMYDDEPGSARQGWWSMVGRELGAPVTTFAQSGSGYLRRGDHCVGDRFIDRTAAYTGPAPSILIVEGGRNDWAYCGPHGYAVAPDDMIAEAVEAYLTTLATFVPSSTHIVLLGPAWGPKDHEHAERVTSILRQAAGRHGLTFIDLGDTLDANSVIDGTHPNRAGSEAIAGRVLKTLAPSPRFGV